MRMATILGEAMGLRHDSGAWRTAPGLRLARQVPPAAPFTLIYCRGRRGRRRCPVNSTPVCVPPPPPPASRHHATAAASSPTNGRRRLGIPGAGLRTLTPRTGMSQGGADRITLHRQVSHAIVASATGRRAAQYIREIQLLIGRQAVELEFLRVEFDTLK